MTPTVPDGPDTELAAAIGFLARNEGLLIELEDSPAGRAAATIVRAYLARPAAGRDLTAQDVLNAWAAEEPFGMLRRAFAAALNEIARPAVARTDGQPPADEPVTILAGDFCPLDGCTAEGRLHTHERDDYDRAVRQVHEPATPADDTVDQPVRDSQ